MDTDITAKELKNVVTEIDTAQDKRVLNHLVRMREEYDIAVSAMTRAKRHAEDALAEASEKDNASTIHYFITIPTQTAARLVESTRDVEISRALGWVAGYFQKKHAGTLPKKGTPGRKKQS